MVQTSGLLVFRKKGGDIEVLIVHPGGPFFTKRDNGVWSIPKGVPDHGEQLENAAIREFREETGCEINLNLSQLVNLGNSRLTAKTMYCFAFEQDIRNIQIKSNTFDIEWPPKGGKMQSFSETDRAEYFEIEKAKLKVYPKQVVFLERLQEYIESDLKI